MLTNGCFGSVANDLWDGAQHQFSPEMAISIESELYSQRIESNHHQAEKGPNVVRFCIVCCIGPKETMGLVSDGHETR
jgi:hypothetical protein